jgi:hypothetical protein
MTDDTKKDGNDETAPPSTPAQDTERPPPSADLLPAIPAGHAQLAVSQALDALTGAYLRLEGVAMAVARALDATTRPPGGP